MVGRVGGASARDVRRGTVGVAAVEDHGQPVGDTPVDQRAEQGHRVRAVLEREHRGAVRDPRHLRRRGAGGDDLVDAERRRRGVGSDLGRGHAALGVADQQHPRVRLVTDRGLERGHHRGHPATVVAADETQGVAAGRGVRQVADEPAAAEALHQQLALDLAQRGHQLLDRARGAEVGAAGRGVPPARESRSLPRRRAGRRRSPPRTPGRRRHAARHGSRRRRWTRRGRPP